MKYDFSVKFKNRNISGSFMVVEFPGNCGYKIIKYIRSESGGVELTDLQKKFIADNVRHYLHAKLENYQKIVVSARMDTTRIFDTIDFIQGNDLLIGTIVRGTHDGVGKTICAEYDLSTETRRAVNKRVIPLEDATFRATVNYRGF